MKMVKTLNDLVNEIHSRTPSEWIIDGKYAVIGTGGIGSWVSIALTLASKQPCLTLVDGDKLELSNLNRLPFPLIYALFSRKKVHALEQLLRALRPNGKFITIDRYLESVDDAIGVLSTTECQPEVLIDTTDNPRTQRLLREAARKAGMPYLGLHYDGLEFTIEWLPVDSTEQSLGWDVMDVPGYQVTPSVIVNPLFVASIALFILQKRPNVPILYKSNIESEMVKMLMG